MKFSAHSAMDLRTKERNEGRLARFQQRNFIAVVTIEADDGSWFELDADSNEHAKLLAETQVDKMNCHGASCWHFNMDDGKLNERNFYMYFRNDFL